VRDACGSPDDLHLKELEKPAQVHSSGNRLLPTPKRRRTTQPRRRRRQIDDLTGQTSRLDFVDRAG
jgi:hypothetical protein